MDHERTEPTVQCSTVFYKLATSKIKHSLLNTEHFWTINAPRNASNIAYIGNIVLILISSKHQVWRVELKTYLLLRLLPLDVL